MKTLPLLFILILFVAFTIINHSTPKQEQFIAEVEKIENTIENIDKKLLTLNQGHKKYVKKYKKDNIRMLNSILHWEIERQIQINKKKSIKKK